jgi:hypothetical protein
VNPLERDAEIRQPGAKPREQAVSPHPRQNAERAIGPGFVRQQVIEHRAAALIGINVEREIDFSPRSFKKLQHPLDFLRRRSLEVRDVDFHPRPFADL